MKALKIHRLLCLACLIASTTPHVHSETTANGSDAINVLVIHSFVETTKFAHAFNKAFDGAFDGGNKFHKEYMAAKNFPQPEFRETFHQYLSAKYGKNSSFGKYPKYIVTVDQAAFDFIVQYPDLFPDIPIVFSGLPYNKNPDKPWEKFPNMTGTFNQPSFDKNLKLISKLHPHRNKIMLMFGNSLGSRAGRFNAELQIRELQLPQTIEFIDGRQYSFNEMYEKLESEKNNISVLFQSWSVDKNSDIQSNLGIVDKISNQMDIPIYGTYSALIHHGIIGGVLISAENQAKETAKILKQIINGAEPKEIPISKIAAEKALFNHKQMERWGINHKQLPSNSTIINQPSSIWKDYREWVIAAGIIISLLLATIMSLLLLFASQSKLTKIQEHSSREIEKKNQALKKELARSNLLTRKLSQANQVKSNFLSVVTHELRTPLNPILGFSELLLEEIHEQEHRSNLLEIQKSGKHLLKLIDNILEYCHYESGESSIGKDQIIIGELVEESIYNFLPKIREKGLQLKYHFPETETHVFSDAHKLKTLFSNLISNAVKFTEKGTIEIAVEVKEEQLGEHFLQTKITDTGIGIPGDVIDSIFKPFFQADTSNMRKHEGIGMGLAMSRGLVATMQGSLTCNQNSDGGMTFTFKVPVFKHVDITQELLV